MRPYLSVVIPVFNEERRLPGSLQALCEYLGAQPYESEIVVADDGSSDSTPSIIRSFPSDTVPLRFLIEPRNRGKGSAVRRGVLASSGELILVTDADLSTPISEVEKLAYWIERGYDIAIGSRALPDSIIEASQSALRQRLGKLFNRAVRALFFDGILDTQCGFKLYRGSVAREVFSFSRIDGHSFDVEVLCLAFKHGYSIREVPVRWAHSPESKVHLFLSGMQMIRDLLRIKLIH